MRVLLVTQFSKLGGSSRIQVLQFVPLLEKAGITCVSLPMYSDTFFRIQNGIQKAGAIRKKLNLLSALISSTCKKILITLRARSYDVILIQRDTFPKFLYALMRKLNPRVIYEIEDTIYEINPFWKKSAFIIMLLHHQAKLCLNMMKGAGWVIAENEYLAAEARKHNKRVDILAAPIDVKAFYPAAKKAKEIMTIGWIGSPSTTYLLETLKPALEAVGKRYANVELKVVGARSDFDISGISLIKKRWSLEDELGDLQSFDLGLMPLDDSPFNRGRLGYKMIQYMSVGIPVVAADIGLNRTVVKNNLNGFLVKDEADWVKHLSLLIEKPELRESLGRAGRKIAEEEFALEKKVEIIVRVIRDIVNVYPL